MKETPRNFSIARTPLPKAKETPSSPRLIAGGAGNSLPGLNDALFFSELEKSHHAVDKVRDYYRSLNYSTSDGTETIWDKSKVELKRLAREGDLWVVFPEGKKFFEIKRAPWWRNGDEPFPRKGAFMGETYKYEEFWPDYFCSVSEDLKAMFIFSGMRKDKTPILEAADNRPQSGGRVTKSFFVPIRFGKKISLEIGIQESLPSLEDLSWCFEICRLTEGQSKLCEVRKPCPRYQKAGGE